LLSTPASN